MKGLSKALITVIFSLSLVLSSYLVVAPTEPFTITENTVYDLLDNTVYLTVKENLGKDQIINIANVYTDDVLTRKIQYKDILSYQSYMSDDYGYYDEITICDKVNEKTCWNVTDNKTGRNDTQVCVDVPECLVSDKPIYCESLKENSCINKKYGVISRTEKYEYKPIVGLAERTVFSSSKIEKQQNNIILPKNSVLKLKYTYSHPIAYGRSVSEKSNKYSIKVTSSSGIDSSTLDPTWWNVTWNYRQMINITSNGNLVNYPVRIDLNNTDVGIHWNWNNNGTDIRFANSTDNELYYWIEAWNLSSQTGVKKTTIWVNVTNLINGTNTIIYMYYGNPSVSSTSDGTKVFNFFDDFESYSEGSNINGQGGWTTLRTGGSGYTNISIINGKKHLSLKTTDEFTVVKHAVAILNTGTSTELFAKSTTLDRIDISLADGTVSGIGEPNNGYESSITSATGGLMIKWVSGVPTYPLCVGTWSALLNNVYMRYGYNWINNNLTAYVNDSMEFSVLNTVYSSQTNIHISVGYTAVWVIDWVLVRTSMNPEPSYVLVSEELYDTIPPQIIISAPTNITYGSANITMNYYGSEPLSSCTRELNNANTTIPNCINGSFTAIEGSNKLKIWANDTAGNVNSTTVYFIVDTIAPTINLISPTNTTYGSTNTTLTYIVSDSNNVSACAYELNNVNTTIPNCINTTFIATEGSNKLKLWVNDTLNNINVTTVYFTIDNTNPTIVINTPTNITYAQNVSLNFNAYDINGLQCKYELNGVNTTIVNCINTTFLGSSGTNIVKIYVNDSSGHTNVSSTISFTTDLTVPLISITSPTNATYTTTNISLIFNAWDSNNISVCKYELNGVNNTLANCINTTMLITSTSNLLKVYANDTFGNSAYSNVNFSYSPPSLTLSVYDEDTIDRLEDIKFTLNNGTNVMLLNHTYYWMSLLNETFNGTFDTARTIYELNFSSIDSLKGANAIINVSFGASLGGTGTDSYLILKKNGITVTSFTILNDAWTRYNITSSETFTYGDIFSIYVSPAIGRIVYINETTVRNLTLTLGSYTIYNNLLTQGYNTITAEKTGYYPRTYYRTISDSNINLDVYLLSQSISYPYVFYIKYGDTFLENASIIVKRFIGINYTTVSESLSQVDGSSTIYLKPAQQYHFTVTLTGYNTYSSTYTPTYAYTNPIYIYLTRQTSVNISGVPVIISLTPYLTLSWYPNETYHNSTFNVTISIHDELNLINYSYVNVTRYNYSSILNYAFANTSDISSINFTVPILYNNNIYYFKVYTLRNNTLYVNEKTYIFTNLTGIGTWNAGDYETAGGFSVGLWAVLGLVVIGVGTAFAYRVMGGFALIFSLIGFSVMGMFGMFSAVALANIGITILLDIVTIIILRSMI